MKCLAYGVFSMPFKAGTVDNLSFNAIESPSSPEVNENDLNSLEVHAKPFSQAIDNTSYNVVSIWGLHFSIHNAQNGYSNTY